MTWLRHSGWLQSTLRLLLAGFHGRFGMSIPTDRTSAPR
jgi:hypothetical protein